VDLTPCAVAAHTRGIDAMARTTLAALARCCLLCLLCNLECSAGLFRGAALVGRHNDSAAEQANQSANATPNATAPAKTYTAAEAKEELATRFSSSAFFAEKMNGWCKKDKDKAMCRMVNTAVHYCPVLEQTALLLFNRTVLANTLLRVIGKQSGLNAAGGLSMLQRSNEAAEHKPKSHHHHSHHTPFALPSIIKALASAAPSTTPAPAVVPVDWEDVTSSAGFQLKLSEVCSGHHARETNCRGGHKSAIMCDVMSEAVLQLDDVEHMSSKMVEVFTNRTDLQFPLYSTR